MIQIDDAGSGSLIGGTKIGFYRPETNTYIDALIPLSYYTKPNMKKKAYLDYVVKLSKENFHKLQVSPNEPIEVCRGYMFDELRKWFNDNNYHYNNVVIKGPLQENVEKSFENYVISLGFPKAYIQYTKYPFHFHRILRWVYADYEKRSALCKIGWKSWCKYENLPTEITYENPPSTRDYYCMKCGKLLSSNDTYKVIHFYSNRNNQIYLHQTC